MATVGYPLRPVFESLESRLLLDSVLTPYLMGVTHSSVFVLQEANSTAPVTVQYGLTQSYGQSVTTHSTEVTQSPNYMHNVLLSNLQPDTVYHYRTIHGNTTSQNYTFKTASPTGDSFRFAFAADMQGFPTVWDPIAGRIISADPDLMVFGGDLVLNGTYAEWHPDFFTTNARTLLANTPWVNATGNHEKWNAVTQAFTQAPYGSAQEAYYSFTYGDAYFLILNTELNTAVGSTQYNWAAADLAASNATWKIVVAHKPAYSNGHRSGDANMLAMTNNLFVPNGVNLVLNGHNHSYQHNYADGIHHLIISPAGTYTYTSAYGPETIYAESVRSYGVFDVGPSSLTVSGYRENGTLIESFTLGAANQRPTANAGNDQTITLPTSQVTLAGSVTDDGLPNPPGAVTTTWSKVSGAGTVTFGNANALNTTATFSSAGVYVLRLTANDGALQHTDDVTITVNTAGSSIFQTDFSSDVSANWSQTTTSITVGSGDAGFLAVNSGWGLFGWAQPTGSWQVNATDVVIEGRVNVGTGNTSAMAELAGRISGSTNGVIARVMGADANAVVQLWDGGTMLASAQVNGLRSKWAPIRIKLTLNGTSATAEFYQAAGSDGGTSWNEVTHTLNGTIVNSTAAGNVRFAGVSYTAQPKLFNIAVTGAGATNTAPVVNAGNDQTITLPATASLSGSASDDGLPNPPGAVTTTWSKTSGPGTVTFGNANVLSTTATFSTHGTYVLRLTANDGQLSSHDELTVTVNQQGQGGLNWTAENVADANTLALYHFNETSGTTAVNAQGDSGRNLTLSRSNMIAYGTDYKGATSYFLNVGNGTAQTVAQAIPTDWTQDLTISFWMKTSDQTSGNRRPVQVSDGLGWKNEAVFTYNAGYTDPYRPKMANVSTQFGGSSSNIKNNLLDGQWHHVAMTHRATDGTARLYVDNTLLHTWSDSGGSNLAATAALYIGNDMAGVTAYIDELLIQRQELTDFSGPLNAAGPTSIFANSGFETGNLDGWSAASGVSVVSNTVGGTGSYVLHVTAGDWLYPAVGNQVQASTSISSANTDYTLSFNIKWNVSTAKTVTAAVKGDGATTITSQAISYIDTTWRTYTINFNSGDMYGNGTEAIYVQFEHTGGAGSARDYYLDEILVYPA